MLKMGNKGWFKKGHIGLLKGVKMSDETKRKLSISTKGKKKTEEHRRHISESQIGISKGKGKIVSEETKLKISKANKGRKLSLEHRKKLSIANKGEKSHLWKGGISYNPYSVDWGQTLKRSIRERDHYTCRVCHSPQGDQTHDVHHIDYDKKNCSPINLITLCRSCHMKTNFNREKWKNYLNNKNKI